MKDGFRAGRRGRAGERARGEHGARVGVAIVCCMLPLASVSGPLFIAVVVGSAALFLGWLLRADTRDEEAAQAERDAALEAEREGVNAR